MIFYYHLRHLWQWSLALVVCLRGIKPKWASFHGHHVATLRHAWEWSPAIRHATWQIATKVVTIANAMFIRPICSLAMLTTKYVQSLIINSSACLQFHHPPIAQFRLALGWSVANDGRRRLLAAILIMKPPPFNKAGDQRHDLRKEAALKATSHSNFLFKNAWMASLSENYLCVQHSSKTVGVGRFSTSYSRYFEPELCSLWNPFITMAVGMLTSKVHVPVALKAASAARSRRAMPVKVAAKVIGDRELTPGQQCEWFSNKHSQYMDAG